MDPREFLDDTTVRVPETRYAVAQVPSEVASDGIPDAFATVRTPEETTVVVAADDLDDVNTLAVERGWRRLTFDVTLPFELVGFLAVVASELAAADVAVFVVSAYSTDHVLVKEADLAAATGQLTDLGCRVQE